MPYANNNGVKIYYEFEGQGPPLVLAHALGASLNMWRRDKYVDALKNDFQVVLIDFRGYDKSDKPHEASACSMKLLADDVIVMLDEIGIGKSHYFNDTEGGIATLTP